MYGVMILLALVCVAIELRWQILSNSAKLLWLRLRKRLKECQWRSCSEFSIAIKARLFASRGIMYIISKLDADYIYLPELKFH